MEKKVTVKLPPKKEHKINDYGKRVIVNWCLYAQVLAKRKRDKERKDVVVSAPTEKDRQVFKKAYQKMMHERAKKQETVKRALKKLASSRSIRSEKLVKIERKVDDDYVSCPINYKAERAKSAPHLKKKLKASKSVKSLKNCKPGDKQEKCELVPETATAAAAGVPVKKPISSIVIQKPPVKTKPWVPPPQVPKKIPRPVVKIPPFKTRPWNPCLIARPKPRVKPTINYPPLTLRKT